MAVSWKGVAHVWYEPDGRWIMPWHLQALARVRDATRAAGERYVTIYEIEQGERFDRMGWATLIGSLGSMRSRGFLCSTEEKSRGGFTRWGVTPKGHGLLRRMR